MGDPGRDPDFRIRVVLFRQRTHHDASWGRIGCWANSLWFLAFAAVDALALNFGVIVHEESYLESKFGDRYLNYKRRVRRWI